jgi:hypothetical protein
MKGAGDIISISKTIGFRMDDIQNTCQSNNNLKKVVRFRNVDFGFRNIVIR